MFLLVLWGECVQTSVYLINRTPSHALHKKTPFELPNHKRPRYNHLGSFGCLCHASTLSTRRTKFNARAKVCVFLGYPTGYKGCKLLDLEGDWILISRHVVFYETIFHLASTSYALKPRNLLTNDVLPTPIPDGDVPSSDTRPQADALSPIPSSTAPSASVDEAKRRRPIHPPAYLSDYITPSIPLACSAHYPLQRYVGNAMLSSHYKDFIMSITGHLDL